MTGCQWLVIFALVWFPASMWVGILCGRFIRYGNPPRPPTNDDLHP